jgi:hypothetical protein
LEDEKHALLKCPLYEDLRQSMFIDVVGHNNNFLTLSDNDTFIFLFNNDTVCNSVAKTCHNILLSRNIILYHKQMTHIIINFKHVPNEQLL